MSGNVGLRRKPEEEELRLGSCPYIRRRDGHVPEDKEKGRTLEIETARVRTLARQGSALVRRGLDDLRKKTVVEPAEGESAAAWTEKGRTLEDAKGFLVTLKGFQVLFFSRSPSC